MTKKKYFNFYMKTTVGRVDSMDDRKEKCAEIIANVRAMDFNKSKHLRALRGE